MVRLPRVRNAMTQEERDRIYAHLTCEMMMWLEWRAATMRPLYAPTRRWVRLALVQWSA